MLETGLTGVYAWKNPRKPRFPGISSFLILGSVSGQCQGGDQGCQGDGQNHTNRAGYTADDLRR